MLFRELWYKTLHLRRGHEVEGKRPRGALPPGMAMGLMWFFLESLHPDARLHLGRMGQPCTHAGSERGPTAESGGLAKGL